MVVADTFRPAMFVAMSVYSKPENKTRSVTLIRLAINLGFSAGPAIGGIIITTLGYSGLFWVDGITCILATLLLMKVLNPRVAKPIDNKIVEHIVPDFAIKIVDGELELTLNGRNAPELHVSREYNNMLKGYKETTKKSKAQKDAVMFIKQKLDAAKWFIEAVRQRQQTLFVTMSSIMHYQKKFFLSGDERNLRPMILKDIADEIEMDVSTISRVANSKYVDTPYGTKLIKEFFSESMTNDQGEEVSTREIKKILETVIEEENKKKPLTDEALSKILKEKGYPIARRTVAKYREQLELPVARLRKEL